MRDWRVFVIGLAGLAVSACGGDGGDGPVVGMTPACVDYYMALNGTLDGQPVNAQVEMSGGLFQQFQQCRADCVVTRLGGRTNEVMHHFAPREHDAPIVLAEAPVADPRELAGCHERIQHRRLIVRDAGGQDFALERRGRQRHALELCQRIPQPVNTAQP